MTQIQYDLLQYSSKSNLFFFQTRNPAVSRIYGISRTAASQKGTVWFFPCEYPAGFIALKDFKNIINGRATEQALARINYLKSIPDKIADQATISSLPIEYKLPPYPHQLEVAESMLHYSRLAVLLEQGMGKTYCTHIFLEALKLIKQRAVKAVVLAPVIVLRNWCRETAANSSFKPLLYRGTEPERLRIREQMQDEDWDILITNYETLTPPSQDFTKTGIINWWMSMSEERRNHLFEYWVKQGYVPKEQPNICELEYRTVKGEASVKKAYLDKVYKIVKKIPSACLLSPALVKAQRDLDDLSFLKTLKADALVLDEGSRIKGHSSQRSQAAMTLAAPIKRRYILSGTLCLGNPTDVYMPMTLLDSNIFGTHYYRFEKNYAVYSPYNKHVVVKWKNLDKLKMRMDPYVIERKRSDCLYLPERIVTNRYYTVTREQYELYNEIISQDEIEIQGITINVSIPVIKLNKINQVLNGHLIFPLQRNDVKCNSCEHVITCVEEDIMPWTKHCLKYDPDNLVPKPKREYYELKKNPKAEELLIQDLELTEGKVIIWAYYTYDVNIIKEVLSANKIKFITADEADCDYKFERDDSYKVFLGQVSQGIGITLNSATTTIYYSHGLGLEPRLQSLDRNYRIGQSNAVLVKDYMGEGTIEESIVELLQHKKDVKDFIQSKVQCQSCKYFIPCFEQGIKPFSQQCIFHGQKVAAEAKHTLKLNELH